MKIALKKLTHSEENSQETYCFSAELWLDGELAGKVRNDGGGGAHRWDMPWETQQRVDAWCRSLAPLTVPDVGPLPMNGELYVSLMVGQMLERRAAQRRQRARRAVQGVARS